MSDRILKKMAKNMRGNFTHFDNNNNLYNNFERFNLTRNRLMVDNAYQKYIENIRDDLNEGKKEIENEKIIDNIKNIFK